MDSAYVKQSLLLLLLLSQTVTGLDGLHGVSVAGNVAEEFKHGLEVALIRNQPLEVHIVMEDHWKKGHVTHRSVRVRTSQFYRTC